MNVLVDVKACESVGRQTVSWHSSEGHAVDVCGNFTENAYNLSDRALVAV